MRKISLIIFVVALAVVLSGCQTLGDKIGNRYGDEDKITAEDGEVMNTEQPEQQEETKSTAAKYNNIFFGSTRYNPEAANCAAVYWVHIDGDDNVDPVERNLKLLLAGPTEKWKGVGYYTTIPEGTKLNWTKVEGDTIYADFSSELNSGGGSCAVIMASKQIEYTAKYAAEEHLGKTISNVVISVEGDTEDVLQP